MPGSRRVLLLVGGASLAAGLGVFVFCKLAWSPGEGFQWLTPTVFLAAMLLVFAANCAFWAWRNPRPTERKLASRWLIVLALALLSVHAVALTWALLSAAIHPIDF